MADLIRMHQAALLGTYTARGCLWEARCEVGGEVHMARSRSGAANALARFLVERGVADGPVEVTQEGLRGAMTYRSLHEMAGWKYKEGDRPLRRVRWRSAPGLSAPVGVEDGG